MYRITIAVLLMVCMLTANGQTKHSQDKAAIKAARLASNASIAQHDVQGIASHWLDNFIQVRGNASYLTGKDTIAATWQQLFAADSKVAYIRNPLSIVISNNDTLAWETGEWKAIHSYSKGGKYSAMWRKAEGTWKIQAELFVSLY